MRIRRIRVENVRCYDEADLELTEGVTVVHGENGSGKTTLLEACFFALYGARALEETLEGFVATGAEDAEVELWFDHGGAEYRVERRIRATGERPTTAKCVLETPDDVVEGARDVRAAIVDLLRMDAEAFVNCAYVRQGEVNALLHATPAERQATIDDLLQLGALEAYRDRAGDARLAVEDALGEVRGELTGVEEQVAEKEDADLHERLNELESERTAVVEEIEHVEAQIEQAEATRDDAREVIEAYEETREELADLREGIDDLGERISETDEEREALRDRLGELREQREAARDRRDELLAESELDVADDGAGPEAAAGVALEAVEEELAEVCERDDELRDELEAQRLAIQELSGEAESAAERAEEFESEAEAKRGEADDLDAELEDDEETLAERREKLEGLESELEDRRSAFEDAPVDTEGAAEHEQGVADGLGELEDERSDLRAELEATADRIERAEELLEAGKCPECGQPVEDSPHVDSLAELREDRESIADRIEALDAERADVEERLERAEELVEAADAIDRLEERRGDLRQLLEEREASIEDKRERVQTLRETAEELEAEVESERETAEAKREAADDEREAIAALNRERKALGEREERLEALAECIEDVADLGEEIEAVRERRELLAEQNEERRETLRERRERASELEDEADEQRVEAARDDLERAEEYLEEAEAELADRRERRDDLQGLVGGVETEIEELEALRERAAALSEERDALESLQAEATTLESTYGDLRAELRQRNVEQLERLLNETFDLVYRNDAYDRIELSGDYELAVYQKDGEPLEPGQLSGGERALFNLSLRCAIYRLLAEGIEGTAPMPPLILDEPTVFLDAGHVSQLVELIDAMTDLGVEQILVVSHDEELLGAADELLRVRKDATTNRSSVEREPVAAAALLD